MNQSTSILLIEDSVLKEMSPVLDAEIESFLNQYELYLLSTERLTKEEKPTQKIQCGLSFYGYLEKGIPYRELLQRIHFSDPNKVLLLSTSQEEIYQATSYGIKTCFVNTGINDTMDLPVSYEVRNINMLSKMMKK